MRQFFCKFFGNKVIAILLIAGGGYLFTACSTDQVENADELERLPLQEITLDNFDAFKEIGENWKIVGGLKSNPEIEGHLELEDGTGILANNPSEETNNHLFTEFEHGDLELELDFLMPKGSNSGVYLMGRYEMQLLDSWGVEDPEYSDLGGIYRQRDESRPEGEKEYGGHPPAMNAARAPGLWQHVRILFKAPEFNESGQKISDAEFEEIWLNGTLIQENVAVSGPTIKAAFEDEQPEGPLMIQGDHGPIAIRNIRYKKYDKNQIHLNDLSYEYYNDSLDQIPNFDTLEVAESGTTDSLSGSIINKNDRYALRYRGTLEASNSGTYLFRVQNAGMVRMLIDDKVIFDQDQFYRMHEIASNTVELESGQHDFTLEYIDHHNNWYGGLGLFTEGPQLRYQKLHASSSVPGGDRELPDLIVEAEDRIKVLRSFAMHEGGKRTHVVNVGAPNKINFSYDMGQAALLHAWNGSFVNTNEMWINRGEPQVASPAGPAFSFDGKPVAAQLNSGTAVWPDSLSWDQLKVEGYTIAEDGSPVFKYNLAGVKITDHLEGEAQNRRLIRTVDFESEESQNDFWMHLASGEEIVQNDTGMYVVDDRTFYLDIIETSGLEPQIVETEEGYDLRIPLLNESPTATIEYAIIW
ncbi:DUF1080 domain-containing protein [Aliifodinibius salicampi]|uniref:DUF1080 domain-containing protein n=1 Tax=Fodinibius salicampi TaxID=1920655 RepID=A0ABT3PWI0_9BACT|nr:family 16 glycoside hydrolase [Fodinibius salicampi]MCW9712207.1 DUF1080 domain-containing protein [Fodinibius salicampi]